MSLDVFEQAINDVSDKDWTWWPFLWIRPEKHARLSLARLTTIAMLYGLPLGGLLSVAFAALDPRARAAASALAAAVPLALLFVGSVVVAPMWNRRADRLRARR
jgi:hypothetical protein